MDQKMIKILGGVIGGFVVLILLLFVISSCTKKTYTYETLEEKMVEVAKSHYQNNPKELPAEDKDTKTLTLKKMITSGYLKEVVELFNNESVKCDGNVTVTNNNGFYLYTPYLSCSGLPNTEDYTSKYLKDVVIEENETEQGVGLYVNGDGYVFKGETQNNYVKMGEKLFRIIAINDDGSIRLFEDDGLTRIKWDDRYNEDTRFNSGFNEYYYNNLDSRIKETLSNYYDDTEVWTDEMKSYITTQTVCTGKRHPNDTSKDGSTECSETLENQVFSLLTTYEYLRASLDETCAVTTDKQCKNYNWFSKYDKAMWTMNADSETSHKVWRVYGTLSVASASAGARANVAFNITDKVIYAGGTGTLEDPYTFR